MSKYSIMRIYNVNMNYNIVLILSLKIKYILKIFIKSNYCSKSSFILFKHLEKYNNFDSLRSYKLLGEYITYGNISVSYFHLKVK